MSVQVFRLATLGGLVFAAFRAMSGCSEDAPPAEPVASAITSGESASSSSGRTIGEFVARVDHATHRFIIEPAGHAAPLEGQLEPQSVNTLPENQFLEDGGTGSPTKNTVDLVTKSVDDEYPTKVFTATVELRSFFTQSLANVYVHITKVTFPDGGAASGYNATNSVDAAANPLGLDATHGLWSYTNGSTNGAYIGANPGPLYLDAGNWTGTQTLIFKNEADENIVYTIEIKASENFSTYTQSFKNIGYQNICGTADSNHMTSSNATKVTLPFDFTIYGTNVTAVNIANNGQMTFGGSNKTTDSGTPTTLPDAGVPAPVFFPFWENLTYATGGEMCWEQIGDDPNELAGFEWKNVTFANAPDTTASLDFEVFLYEGTGEIDTVYAEMIGADGGTPGRETGSQAWVGMQNNAATVATGTFEVGEYGTDAGWSYLPSP